MEAIRDMFLKNLVYRNLVYKKMLLEIPQNSQKNTCARVSFLIKKRLVRIFRVFLIGKTRTRKTANTDNL